MKNAGIAGAVALVGIGLLSIGLSNFANRAEAVPSGTASNEKRLGPGTVCRIENSNWFEGEGRDLCSEQGVFPDAPYGDLNGDGTSDTLWWVSTPWRLGTGWEDRADYSLAITTDGDGTRVTWTQVLDAVHDWYEAEFGGSNLEITRAAVTDIDGDGRRDLVIRLARGSKNTYRWHRNITMADPLVADINRDGFVNAQDLGLLIAAWTG